MIKCAIIGFGKMGKIRANSVEETGLGEIIGIYDTNPDIKTEYQKYNSEKSIFSDSNVDAIFVCTPNYQIARLCKEGLEAGKHVFSEKPPAFNSSQLVPVQKAELNSGRVLMYGFNHRHHESVQQMKSIIDSRSLGRPLWLRGRYGKEVDSSFLKSWRADKRLAGGGIMLDQGIHMLDLFLYLGGGFDEVQSLVSNLFWKIDGIEDNVFAQFRCSKTGLCASLHSTMTQWRYLFSLEIFLEEGALILNGLKTSSGAYGDEVLSVKHNVNRREEGHYESEERIIFKEDASWNSEIEMFFESIQKEESPKLGNSKDAKTIMKLIDKIYRNE